MNNFLKYDINNQKKIDLSPFGIKESNLYIYDDTNNHPRLSGNKLRKLYGNIVFIKENNIKNILTIGGNYSNYIYAVSQLKEILPINIHLIIKGREPKEYGYTLNEAKNKVNTLEFIPHKELKENLPSIINKYKSQYPDIYYIPEGGSNELSYLGYKDLVQNHFDEFDTIYIGVGTGASYDSFNKYKSSEINLIGYPALKDYSLIENNRNLIFDYDFGGFAKVNQNLVDFVSLFYKTNKIILDPIYTSKMLFGIIDGYKKGLYTVSQKNIAIHTGGLQGWYGIQERNPKLKIDFFS